MIAPYPFESRAPVLPSSLRLARYPRMTEIGFARMLGEMGVIYFSDGESVYLPLGSLLTQIHLLDIYYRIFPYERWMNQPIAFVVAEIGALGNHVQEFIDGLIDEHICKTV
jgi:hypothetical protein